MHPSAPNPSSALADLRRRDTLVVVRDGPRTTPDISILLPVYNQERFVAAAVRSVLQQIDVTAEVIISDDASDDRTWDVVTQTVAETPSPHRVVLRRGSQRLRRDHPVVLADAAASDLVVNAHGDDVSEPHRAREFVTQFARPEVVLVGSKSTIVDEMATRQHPVAAPTYGTTVVPRKELVNRPNELVGAVIGWRRSAFTAFPRLDTSFAACLHDRVLPFRAGLVGEVVVIEQSLVQRRLHLASWSKSMWDLRSPEAGAVGAGLYLLTSLRAMDRDLVRADELGLLDPSEVDELAVMIETERDHQLTRALDAHEQLVNNGRFPLWVTDRELNAAWRGDLFAALERRAALAGLVVRLRTTSRKLSGLARRVGRS